MNAPIVPAMPPGRLPTPLLDRVRIPADLRSDIRQRIRGGNDVDFRRRSRRRGRRLTAPNRRKHRKQDQGESPIGQDHIHNLYMRPETKRREADGWFFSLCRWGRRMI